MTNEIRELEKENALLRAQQETARQNMIRVLRHVGRQGKVIAACRRYLETPSYEIIRDAVDTYELTIAADRDKNPVPR